MLRTMRPILHHLPFICMALVVILSCAQDATGLNHGKAKSSSMTDPASDWPSAGELKRIGYRIWRNESSGTTVGLTAWNPGEDFASLGIGHFIWYPEGPAGPFEESFPQLIGYLKSHPAAPAPPAWVWATPDCPWPTRRDFIADINGQRLGDLRTYLVATTAYQAEFMLRRLVLALPKITAQLDAANAQRVRNRFTVVLRSHGGAYALIDYVNFKGEGVKLSERYRGEGWGLLQVLEQMQGQAVGSAALDAFADAAQRILRRRVGNSPPDRNEKRWLKGWLNRCETYRSRSNE
jgi:hypothetical protein